MTRSNIALCTLLGLIITAHHLFACAAEPNDCVVVTVSEPQLDDESWSGCVDVAKTEAERIQGLQGRAPLLPTEGLLLVFSVEDELCVHNVGVSFSIDAVFLDQDLQVIEVARGLPPFESESQCVANAKYILELLAGQADNIQTGDILSTDAIL